MAENIGNLNVKLKVDMADFQPDLRSAGGEVNRFVNSSDGILRRLGGSFEGVGEKARGFLGNLASANGTGALTELASGVGGVVDRMLGAPGVIGRFVSSMVSGFRAVADAAREANTEIQNTSRFAAAIGETSENAQVVQRALEREGFNREESNTLLQRFFARLGDVRQDPNGSAARRFRAIGLDPTALTNLGPARALEETLVALNQISNTYDRANAAQDAFGREFVHVSDMVRRGRFPFSLARSQVERYGISGELSAQASEATFLRRVNDQIDFDRNARRGRDGQGILSSLDLAWQRLRADANGVFDRNGNIRPEFRVQSRNVTPTELRFDAARDAKQTRLRQVATDGETLLTQWRDLANVAGLTTRAAAIYRLEQAGATAEQLGQLRTYDAILSRTERVNRERQEALQRERQILDGLVTPLQRFNEQLRRIQQTQREQFTSAPGVNPYAPLIEGGLDPAAARLARARAFLDLERQLGGNAGAGGPSSFAISGIDPRSAEGARFLDDLRVRRNLGGAAAETPQERIRRVLEQINAREQQQLAELEGIGDALDAVLAQGLVLPAAGID